MEFSYIISVLLVLLALSSVDAVCTTGQVYIKTLKKSRGYSYEESFTIRNGADVVTCPILADNEIRETEFCISQSTNFQYTLEMTDSAGDSWGSGCWLEIRGLYNNIVYKNYMVQKVSETTIISLYMPIMKTSTWKMTSGTVTGTWKTLDYTAAGWAEVTTGSTTAQSTGTQYFRKTFAGITGMAAYEVQFNYRYGIVAYVNGIEIYRDNMDQGVVESNTPATGSYTTVGYKGVIRPSTEVPVASVLAVELHYLVVTSTNVIDFDAYVAEYAPTIADSSCYVVPYEVTTTSNAYYPSSFMDYNPYSYSYAYKPSLPLPTFTFSYNNHITPYVNGLRIWQSSSVANGASALKLEGRDDSMATDTYNTITTVGDLVYASQTTKFIYSYFFSKLYTNYRVSVMEYTNDFLNVFEMTPSVCALTLPTSILFPQTTYNVVVDYQTTDIHPTLSEFVQCSVLPLVLPTGVTLNADTCTITGVPTTLLAETVFTLSSVTNGKTYTGTFTYSAYKCTGTMMEFLKVSTYYASSEGFTITNTNTNTVILTVAPNSGQLNNKDVSYSLCITPARLSIEISSTSLNWYSGSYLYITGYLSSTERDIMRRIRYDSQLGLPIKYYVNAIYSVSAMSQWYYKMSEVPADWYNTVTTGWTEAATGSFPEPSNRIQLYKKIFTISSLADVAGYTVTMKYKYGCVIYMNGVEVFRNGVAAGPVTTTSEVTNFYNDITFHTVSLPARTMTIGTTTGAAILIQGSNTIAIALVAMSDTQKTVTFDATVNLMGENEVSRVFDFTATTIGGSLPSNAFNHFNGGTYYRRQCGTNSLTITFNNYRREWISSIALQIYIITLKYLPVEFTMEARNLASEEWVPLKTVTKLSWSLVGQKKKIWILNNTPYNMYRFSNFGTGSTTNCHWKVNRIDLYSDNLSVEMPALTYTSPPIFKNIEMAEAYPSNGFYTDFTITPNLPVGLFMDPQVGVISGTATEAVATQNYNVQARKATGEAVTAVLSLGVMICTGIHNLITVVIRSDTCPTESSARLYKGKDNSGQLIKEFEKLPVGGSLIYIDTCLDNAIYFFEARDTYGDGWYNPNGYTMSIDVGAMYFDMQMVPDTRPTKPTVVSNLFSSYLPFQFEYSEYKYYSKGDVASTWKDIAFNEEGWDTLLASKFGTSEFTTVYVRKTFDIPNLDDYSVLNVRVKYTGGVVAYFNGKKVARFNLEEIFTPDSSSIVVHDALIASKFHILLQIDGAQVGNNVIAFEIHRPLDGSSASPIVFDSTGVFGVMTCSTVLDSYYSIDLTAPTEGAKDNLFDLFPYNTCILPNVIGTYVTWKVDNLEGSRFNTYGMYSHPDVTGWSMSLYGRNSEIDEWMAVSEVANKAVKSRIYPAFDASPSIVGFSSYKWEVDNIASKEPTISSFVFRFCKATGDICVGADGYPTVGEGQISPHPCDDGFTGYKSKKCSGGVFGAENNEKCRYKAPMNLQYLSGNYKLVKDVAWTSGKPDFVNIITNFKIDKGVLPDGLIIDAVTGIISGIPTTVQELTPIEIRGENPVSSVKADLSLSVRVGECKSEGVFATTPVNVIATYQCSSQGAYIGSQTRPCILGATDGEWQKISGFCMPVFMIVLVVIIVIFIATASVFIIVRTGRKRRAVGGVKGKKSKASIKGSEKGSKSDKMNKIVKV